MRTVVVRISDEAMRMTTRQIEPQFLFFCVPAWYLLSWDRLRDDIRTFRIDRIQRAVMMDTAFRLRNRRKFIDWAGGMAQTL